MIATWMLYATGLGLAFGLAALALEHSLRLFNRPGRWVWLAAIAASLIVPVALALVPARAPVPTVSPFIAVSPLTQAVPVANDLQTRTPAPPPGPGFLDRLATFDRPLLIGWALASLISALVLLVGHIGLRRDLARWPAERVDDQAVLVSPDLGPAVVGAWRGVVVLPTWARDLKSDVRALIVRHEAEHVAAADALLLLVAAFAVVVCPWNLALWWQRARLRDAVELDCDGRVIRSGADPIAYGALLLDVARRSAGVPKAAIALAAPPSLLSRRIAMLISPAVRARAARAVFGVAVGGLLVALACEAPHPLAPVLPAASADARADLPSPILTRTVGSIEYPRLLAEAGIGGTVVLAFDVRPDGSVQPGTIRPLMSTNEQLESAPIPWLLDARFAVPGARRADAVRVKQEFDFAVMGSNPAPVNDDAPVQPPYPIRTNYWSRGFHGDAPQPRIESRWRGPESSFAFGQDVVTSAPKPGGFAFTTRQSVGGAPPSALPQNIVITKTLLEPGNQGTASVDFVAYADGHVDPASIKFTQPAPAALEDAVRQSILAADFKPAFVGSQAASRVAHQSVRFTVQGTGAAVRPDTLQTTTMWDKDAPVTHSGTVEPQGTMPVRIAGPSSPYPALLREAGIEGKVVLAFTVKADGRVDSASMRVVSSSHREFQMSASIALRRSVFKPATSGGQPVAANAQIEFYFRIDGSTKYATISPAPSGFLAPVVVTASPTSRAPRDTVQGVAGQRFGRVLAGDSSSDPQSLKPMHLVYPQALVDAGVYGLIFVNFTVDSTGQIPEQSITTPSGQEPRLEQLVLRDLRAMTFRPATIDGRRVAEPGRREVAFTLPRAGERGGPWVADELLWFPLIR